MSFCLASRSRFIAPTAFMSTVPKVLSTAQKMKIFRIVFYPGIETQYVEVQVEDHGGSGTVREERPIELTQTD